jgi:hypothetical protein
MQAPAQVAEWVCIVPGVGVEESRNVGGCDGRSDCFVEGEEVGVDLVAELGWESELWAFHRLVRVLVRAARS